LGEIYISNFTIKPSNHLFSKTWLTNFEAKGYTLSLCCNHDRIQTLAMSFTSVSGYWNYTQLSLCSNCNSETPYSVDGILYWGPCEDILESNQKADITCALLNHHDCVRLRLSVCIVWVFRTHCVSWSG
jgi:hypothetical protein